MLLKIPVDTMVIGISRMTGRLDNSAGMSRSSLSGIEMEGRTCYNYFFVFVFAVYYPKIDKTFYTLVEQCFQAVPGPKVFAWCH